MGANVLIMAGGTGGHVFPALACAREFQARGYTVHWLGTPRGIENELVPAAGLELHRINATGLRGKGKLSLLKAPFMLLKSVWQARAIIRRLKPVCGRLRWICDWPRWPRRETGRRAGDRSRAERRGRHRQSVAGAVRRPSV